MEKLRKSLAILSGTGINKRLLDSGSLVGLDVSALSSRVCTDTDTVSSLWQMAQSQRSETEAPECLAGNQE